MTANNYMERCEFYLDMLERGYRFAIKEGHSEIPIDALLSVHQQFRDGGYKCESLWKKKLLREEDMYLFFHLKITAFDIKYELEVMDKKKTVVKAHGLVAKAEPYSTYLFTSFRKLVITEECIYVFDFLDKPFCSISKEALRQGMVIVKYHDDNFVKNMARTEERIKQITW